MGQGEKGRPMLSKGPRHTIVTVLIVLLLLASAVLACNRFEFRILLVGDGEQVLEYGETYLEPGAMADFRGTLFYKKGISPDVTVTANGTVDTSVTGTYTVTYSADFRHWHAETIRTVHVVDNIAPELTLEGDREVYVRPGESYLEPGYCAWDAYEGDLTSMVQSSLEDGVVTYWVCDTAGNRTEATRILHYEDPVPPEITLSQGTVITWPAGVPFVDPGFTATDNCDGDMTSQVRTEGAIPLYYPGSYPLTYTVTDSFGNQTTVERTVLLIAQAPPVEVHPEGKVIYLTFDDGPGPYTRQLLAILDKYDVKATFFVVCNKYADVVGEIAAAGHTVGIHTACHHYRTIYASEEAFFADLEQVQQMILEQTGAYTNVLRFPGGSSNKVSNFNKGIMTRLAAAVHATGFQYFDWNVDSNDAGGAKTATEVYQNVIRGISGRRIAVVLQHDIKGFSVDAVERIIRWGLANGYEFRALDVNSPAAHHNINN